MIYVKSVAGAIVQCAANDPDAHVLFSAAEARDKLVRRDLVQDSEVAALAKARADGSEPDALRMVVLWALGKIRSPYEPKG